MKNLVALALGLALCTTSGGALADTVRSVAAAGYADKTMALYFSADYGAPEAGERKNLRIKSGQVIFVLADEDGKKTRIKKLNCENDESILAAFQDSPYGRGSVGRVLGLKCSQQQSFIFLIYAELDQDRGLDSTQTCGKSAMLNSAAAALPASFGHQAFCMEDWSTVRHPAEKLSTEFLKFRKREAD